MASTHPPINPMSDKNCKKTCRLQYGISEIFERIVLEQQKVKATKSHINTQPFTDPNDQKLYSHMLDDVMIKTFDNEDEQKVFRKSLEGMNSNYNEIFTGEEKNMFYAPSSFNFDSRIKEDESCVPDALDEMQATLESKRNLTSKESSNLKKIQDHLCKLRPQLAEQEFVDALACFFYQQRGIFVHSLKLDDHLKVLTNKAREYRRQNKNMGFALTDFENNLKEQLNIDDQTLIDAADNVVNDLLANSKTTGGQLVNGRLIRTSIDNQLKGNDMTCAKKLFKPGQDYSIDDVKAGTILGKFESECRVAGENDIMIMLPDSKLFLCVEIKRHMKSKDRQDNTNSKIDKNMISASQQLKKNANFIARMHGAILSPEWQFVKICALSPELNNSESICDHCKKFILTTDILKTPGGLKKWWEETGLSKRATLFDQKSKDASYNEFQLFFNRLICMSSVKVVTDAFNTWNQVQGKTPYHMSAGLTNTEQATRDKAAAEGLDVEDVLKAAHHAYKVLFFNKDQMAILTTDRAPHTIFMCDFGAGKSLISKEKAIQTDEKERNEKETGVKAKADPVFFISMVGVHGLNHEHIFDIFTKLYDFSGTNIQVISAQDLWKFYKKKQLKIFNPRTWKKADKKKVNIYQLVEFFILHHPSAHYILDECPLLTSSGGKYDATSVKKFKEFIKNCQKQLKSETNLFWIALQSNILADLSSVEKDFEEALTEMKDELKKEEWIFPTLHANMRNQVNIANINIENGNNMAYKMQSSIEKLKSGSSLTGEVPLLFKVRSNDWKTKKDEVLKHCLEFMKKKNEKNVVVLWDWNSMFKDVADDIKRVIKDKKIVSYPSEKSEQEGILNVKEFVEKNDHILVTEGQYFNGCEATNVIFLTYSSRGLRNCILRGVQNIICVQLLFGVSNAKISGMKEDNRFLYD